MSDGFFVAALPATVAVADIVTVTGPEGRHAVTVRRIRPGEIVTVTDGSGCGVIGPVAATGRDTFTLDVAEVVHAAPSQPQLVCVQALPKSERADLAVDLLTEVGVDRIVPWQASRSVVRWTGERAAKSLAKWRTVAREASKQSRRLRFPQVDPVASTADVSALLAAADLGLVLHEAAIVPLSAQHVGTRGTIVVVVGPEGGIAPDELAAFTAAGATPVLVGTTVLRSVTAGAVGLAGLRILVEQAGRA